MFKCDISNNQLILEQRWGLLQVCSWFLVKMALLCLTFPSFWYLRKDGFHEAQAWDIFFKSLGRTGDPPCELSLSTRHLLHHPCSVCQKSLPGFLPAPFQIP